MGNEIAVGSSSKLSVEWPEDYFLTQQLPYSDWVKSYGQIANAFSGFWMKWKHAASKMCQEVDIFVSINIFLALLTIVRPRMAWLRLPIPLVHLIDT